MLTFVTGASGHIGGNLVRLLLAQGRAVLVAVHEDERSLSGLDVEKVVCNVSNPDDVNRALKGVDVVYHCAAKIAISPKTTAGMLETNIEGTRNIVEAALKKGVRRLVHFSSIHALSSRPENETIDETRPLVDHDSPMLYDHSKAQGERIVLSAVEKGLDVVIVNPTAVIGPFDFKPSLMGEFLLMVLKKRLPALVAGGFNWVDVRDVAAGAIAAEKKGRRGERYLLGGEWESVAGLAAMVGEIMKEKTARPMLPRWIAHLGVPFLALAARAAGKRPLYTHDSLRALMHHRYVSSKKAETELAYCHRSLSETIRDTCLWFKEKGYIS